MDTNLDTNNKNTEEEELSFDWKKKGIGNKERLTLKNDSKEASKYKNDKKTPLSSKSDNKPENLPAGLLKLRKKIKDIYDEEDDENDSIFAHIKMPEQEEETSLLYALTEDEKRDFNQKNTIHNAKMQQDAGKMEALHIAVNLAKEAGLNSISKKALEAGMQEATFNPQNTQEKIIKKEIGGKLGIKGKIEEGKVIEAAKGIKKIEQLGGKEATKNMDMKDIVKAGEQKLNDQKLAKMILEKSGQEVKLNKNAKKSEVKLKHFENDNTIEKTEIVKNKNIGR